MNILITICGRGGSKGVKNKNIRPINNLPLIAYSIYAAQKFAKKHNGILIPMSLLAVLLVAPAITKPTVRSLKPIFFPYA